MHSIKRSRWENAPKKVTPIHLRTVEVFVQLNKTDQQIKLSGSLDSYRMLFMASFVCIWGPSDMKKLETGRGGETGRENVGGRGFQAGPFMSAVIIVRLKVGHTLSACSHKEQECSHCAGRLAGWEYYGRAELCRARHGQELPRCLTAQRCLCLPSLPLPHSYVHVDNMW